MDQINIEDNPGGSHSRLENLGEPPRGKDAGIRLAWGEGWPTYFGTVLQQIKGTAAFGIPNVGDIDYTDIKDVNFTYSLESQTGGNSLGEDNELSVMRILWDYFDSADDAGDSFTGDDIAVWENLDLADATTLSSTYLGLPAGLPITRLAKIGCILSEHRVAPDPTAQPDRRVAPMTPPTFQWWRSLQQKR